MKRKGKTHPTRGTPRERFWRKVDKAGPNGCWNWLGALVGYGYGHFRVDRRTRLTAHVFAYIDVKGEYDRKLQLDHLCRNFRCVRPDHLEPVPGRVNFLRSSHPAAVAARTNTCHAGHSLLDAYQHPTGRMCRTCKRVLSQRLYLKKRRLIEEARRQIAIFHGITYLTPEGREEVLHHELRDPEREVG